MQKKTASVNVRVPDALKARLNAIHLRHATNDATVVIRLIEAFCDHVEREGKVEFPIAITKGAEHASPTRRAS